MKLPSICFLIAALASAVHVQARLVTLVINPASSNYVAELRIEDFEVAELVSFPSEFNSVIPFNHSFYTRIEIEKGEARFQYQAAPWAQPAATGVGSPNWVSKPPLEPLIIAGPALIRLKTNGGTQPGLCTFKVTPESYPPDKSLIVLPGTNGASVTLECSTNLVNGFPATNGVYNNLNEAKFFRIRADRLR